MGLFLCSFIPHFKKKFFVVDFLQKYFGLNIHYRSVFKKWCEYNSEIVCGMTYILTS